MIFEFQTRVNNSSFTLGCEKHTIIKETWHITYVENLATQTHENPEDIVNINKSPSKFLWTWTMVPWSHPSTLVIAINQQTNSLWESPDGSILIRFICEKGDVGESTGKVDDLYKAPFVAHHGSLMGYNPRISTKILPYNPYIYIYISFYLKQIHANHPEIFILKYLDLGIWNWIIPKNKTRVCGYRMYSRMAVHRNRVERDLTIPLITLALSGGACCFAIVFCMDKCWYAESPEEISNWIFDLWLSVGSFIQVHSNEVSILIPTCQQENLVYIYISLLCPFWQRPVSTIIPGLVGAFGFGRFDVLGDPTFPQNKPS